MGRDAVVILALRVVGTALWMVYTITLARTLSKPDFAVALYSVNFALVAVIVVTLGRDVAMMRLAARAWQTGARASVRRALIRTRWSLLSTGLVTTVGLVVATGVGIEAPVTQSVPVALLTGLITTAGAQMGLNRDCLRAIGKVWQSQLGFNITRTVIPIVGSVVVIRLTELTAELALLLFLLSLLLSLMIEEILLQRIEWSDSDQVQPLDPYELRRSGLALWPGDIANAVQVRAAGLIAGLVLPPEAVALFLAGERVAGLAQFPIAAAAQAAAPLVARATMQGEAETQAVLAKASLLMTIGALIGAAGAAAIAYPALLALGRDFTEALPLTLLLIAAHLSWAFFGLAQTALNLMGRHRIYSALATSAAVIAVAAVWIGAREGGGTGAAAAFCVVWWLTNIAYTGTLRSSTGLRTGILSVGREVIVPFLTRMRRR